MTALILLLLVCGGVVWYLLDHTHNRANTISAGSNAANSHVGAINGASQTNATNVADTTGWAREATSDDGISFLRPASWLRVSAYPVGANERTDQALRWSSQWGFETKQPTNVDHAFAPDDDLLTFDDYVLQLNAGVNAAQELTLLGVPQGQSPSVTIGNKNGWTVTQDTSSQAAGTYEKDYIVATTHWIHELRFATGSAAWFAKYQPTINAILHSVQITDTQS